MYFILFYTQVMQLVNGSVVFGVWIFMHLRAGQKQEQEITRNLNFKPELTCQLCHCRVLSFMTVVLLKKKMFKVLCIIIATLIYYWRNISLYLPNGRGSLSSFWIISLKCPKILVLKRFFFMAQMSCHFSRMFIADFNYVRHISLSLLPDSKVDIHIDVLLFESGSFLYDINIDIF